MFVLPEIVLLLMVTMAMPPAPTPLRTPADPPVLFTLLPEMVLLLIVTVAGLVALPSVIPLLTPVTALPEIVLLLIVKVAGLVVLSFDGTVFVTAALPLLPFPESELPLIVIEPP